MSICLSRSSLRSWKAHNNVLVGTMDPIILSKVIVDLLRPSARNPKSKIRLTLAAILGIEQSNVSLVGLVGGWCNSLTDSGKTMGFWFKAVSETRPFSHVGPSTSLGREEARTLSGAITSNLSLA